MKSITDSLLQRHSSFGLSRAFKAKTNEKRYITCERYITFTRLASKW